MGPSVLTGSSLGHEIHLFDPHLVLGFRRGFADVVEVEVVSTHFQCQKEVRVVKGYGNVKVVSLRICNNNTKVKRKD